jgi:hypothetical protein
MTPFEVRLELLKLAQSIECDRTQSQRTRLENNWHSQRELALANNQSPPDFPELEIIDANKILQVAEQLNYFVSGSKSQ